MNEAKAFELSIASVIRNYSELGSDTRIRPFQSPSEDPSWGKAGVDRFFPCVAIESSGAELSENTATMTCAAAVRCMTKADDDQSREIVSAMYDGICSTLWRIYSQFKKGVDGDELTEFKSRMTQLLGSGYTFGGIFITGGQPPAEDGGVNILSTGLTLHFSVSDFAQA